MFQEAQTRACFSNRSTSGVSSLLCSGADTSEPHGLPVRRALMPVQMGTAGVHCRAAYTMLTQRKKRVMKGNVFQNSSNPSENVMLGQMSELREEIKGSLVL